MVDAVRALAGEMVSIGEQSTKRQLWWYIPLQFELARNRLFGRIPVCLAGEDGSEKEKCGENDNSDLEMANRVRGTVEAGE